MESVTKVTLPGNELQARPLTRIGSPEQRAEVWAEVVEEANADQEPVTAKRVEGKIRARRPRR